jgi:uncharacterized protein
MSKWKEEKIFYFNKKGPDNTDKTIEIALDYCAGKNVSRIVVASSTGETALKLKEKAPSSIDVIAVTYSAGSRYRQEVEEFNKNQTLLLEKGIRIVRGLHALSGVERGFEGRYKTGFIPLNIVSDTLRMFSQGVKVCIEISVMAAEHGLISLNEDVIALGGTGSGADTALVLRPAYASNIFDAKIKAVLCMPE